MREISIQPLVSVLLCVRNGGQFLGPAIDSVLNQAWTSLELIVVNDGSTDNTQDLLTTIASEDPRVKVLHNAVNLGLTKSLNIALRHSAGSYIARIDHDDLWLPSKLSQQIEYLEHNPSICLLGTKFLNLSDQGLSIPLTTFVEHDAAIKEALYRQNPFMHSSIVVRACDLHQIGGYDESFRFAQDYALWTKLLSSRAAATLPEVLCYRRVCASSISFKNERQQRICAMRAKLNWCRHHRFSSLVLAPLLRDLLVIASPALLKERIRKIMDEHRT